MVKAGRGRILNVASLGAFIPDPYFNVYGPTKAFELFLTQAMYGELKGSGVSVSVLCPGPVKTDWAKNAGKADSRLAKDPALIARIGFRQMQRGKLIIVPTLLYKAEKFGMNLLPVRARITIIRSWQRRLIGKEPAGKPE
jgi:short-subunit dehydrogenase